MKVPFSELNGFMIKQDIVKHLNTLKKHRLLKNENFFCQLKKIGDFGKIFDKTKFRYEGDEIYAFKPQPDRYLCFFKKGKKIIVTNGFCKRTNKLPLAEKAIALENKQMYEHLYEE